MELLRTVAIWILILAAAVLYAQKTSNGIWVTDKGHASAMPGEPSEHGVLDVKAPAPDLKYCANKLCIEDQTPPVRFYPIMWTDKEWKVTYAADPIHPMHEHGDEQGGSLRLSLSVKFVPDPAADPECTGSLQSAKELKAFPLGDSCYVYKKVR